MSNVLRLPHRILVMDLTVPGEPVPKARARVTAKGTFTPAKTREAEIVVGILARSVVHEPVEGELRVEMDFYVGNRRRVDGDNLMKMVWDGLNGIVWADDSQVIEWSGRKLVDREVPRTQIRVWKVA